MADPAGRLIAGLDEAREGEPAARFARAGGDFGHAS